MERAPVVHGGQCKYLAFSRPSLSMHAYCLLNISNLVLKVLTKRLHCDCALHCFHLRMRVDATAGLEFPAVVTYRVAKRD